VGDGNVDVRGPVRESETTRQDAGHHERFVIEMERAADDVRVRPEPPLPEADGENRYLARIGMVLFRQEIPGNNAML